MEGKLETVATFIQFGSSQFESYFKPFTRCLDIKTIDWSYIIHKNFQTAVETTKQVAKLNPIDWNNNKSTCFVEKPRQ